MIYLDTNVLVAYINPKDKLHNKAIYLVSKHRRDKIVISPIVLLELYSVFSRTMNLDDSELKALVNYTVIKCGVEVIDIDLDELYNRSSSYANKLKLKTLDLLHVISAYLSGSEIILSFDKDLNNRSSVIEKVLGLRVLGL